MFLGFAAEEAAPWGATKPLETTGVCLVRSEGFEPPTF